MKLVKYLSDRKRTIARAALLVIVIGAFINLALAAFFHDRTYPNAKVADKSVGNMSVKDLRDYLSRQLLAQKITIAYSKESAAYTPIQLGVQADALAIANNLTKNHWLPVYNLLSTHTSEIIIKTDSQKMMRALDEFASQYPQEEGSDATLRIDSQKAQKVIAVGIISGKSRIELPTLVIKAASAASAPVAPQPQFAKKIFTYCTAVKGVDPRYLTELDAKLASTYADDRGWSLDGAIGFVKATSNCNFTVWLSAASEMPSFGAICDSMWSCAVSPNVVLNFDRWQGASAAWNGGGGSLDGYRTMVINHETGHWLGFYHQNCGGAGRPAPVMQQQSIDMQGCAVNSWPLQAERDQLRKHLKL